MDPWSFIYMFVVAIIWGFTNPLMKYTTSGIEKCAEASNGSANKKSKLSTFWAELKFVFTNWKYVGAYLLNQSGSLLFYYTLGQVDLSIASPLTNTLTFIFTYISGAMFFGEGKENPPTLEQKIGLGCICAGVICCMIDKL